MNRHLHFNAFHMNAPAHSWAGFWRHPRDRSLEHNTLDYWVELARTAERGLFDGVFLADGKRTNMENYGVQPDIFIENAPEDNLSGRDRQIEAAVDQLMKELGGK